MKKILFLLLPLVSSGCFLNFSKDNEVGKLPGTWRLYDVELEKGESGGSSFSEMASLKQVVKEGAIFCFTGDGQYTELKGQGVYKKGTWKFLEDEETKLQFIADGKTPLELNVEIEKSSTGKQVLSLQNKQHNTVLKFIKQTEEPKDFHDDPFYEGNNQWRIRPASSENDGQKLKRFLNYIKHVALILKSAKENKQEIISFEYSQGPVKIYNGGIGIHPYTLVPDSWKATFYNEEEALLTYRMFDKYLENSRYKGAGTGNWVEDDYNILLSIYADLQKQQTGNHQ